MRPHGASLCNLFTTHRSTHLIILIISTLIQSVNSHQWTPMEYPDPQNDFEACGLKEKGFVCDPDGVLEYHDRWKLNDLILGFHEAAMGRCITERCGNCTNYPGIYLGVAIAYKIYEKQNIEYIDDDGDGITDRTEVTSEPPQDWARDVAVGNWNWQYRVAGKEKACLNTAVIYFSAYEEKAYMAGGNEVRYTSEFSSIIRQTSHLLHNIYDSDDAYYKGLKAMVGAYWARLREHRYEGGDDYKRNRTIAIVIVVVLAVGMLVCLAYTCYATM